ncbi:unnamed protein product [Rotaria sp. Silwood1]|nr:unnamed protein product [Rotaria sp. Silwood1]CAF1660698.1 unnamed protein product [Rotaria sp. Silwood1]
MNKFFLAISIICFVAINDGAKVSKGAQNIILTGRVTFPEGSSTPVEPDGKLTVELQDTSRADAPAKVIARGTSKVIKFPVVFGIKYSSNQITPGQLYSLHANIRNKKNELLYTNNVRILVPPLNVDRKKPIEVPVVLVKKANPGSKKSQWPELVGKKGNEAVQIIKKETGFTNVVLIKEGSPVTADYNMDRVRITVNKQGIVTQIPMIS